jgi:hypothetical protein
MINQTAIIGLVVLAIVLIGSVPLVRKLRPRKLKTVRYQVRWQDIQKLCGDKQTWPLAVINADKMLDDVLKRLRFKGSNMGERLVSAQRKLSDNDSVWFGHKLRNKLVHEEVKLRERDVKQALVGIRQALKDLGAL